MAKYISVTETAKLIRQALKDNFKGIKFSVRSNSYAGGASIDVSWTDGPCEPVVNSVVKKFQGASFDGMTDSTTYHTSELNGEEVHFGSDYVMTRRRYSRAFMETITKQFCNRYGIPMLEIGGSENDAWANTNRLDYSTEHWFRDLVNSTDAKDMHHAYQAKDQQEARRQAAWEAQEKKEAKARAAAKAKAEQEAKEREQAEFAQWQQEQMYNEAWQREQFKKWQIERTQQAQEAAERAHQAKEQAQRERQRREQEEQARRQREQQQRESAALQKRTILATKTSALAYLGLSFNANREEVLKAFRAKVKASSDGQGGYTGDMDLLVKAKEKALS